ncbi:MAG: hypothetical protein QGF21_00965 [Vicinamibacterales bacterium]|jgi:hypothetical protein|nr:hypothetical protein [Acidobacteriota bacterium]MDP7473152.1 hypothetical protein [Vicinamibacterales bacterium]MDP7670497.1 hypothetical protein [Vicinamibacterales bacterium]HJO38155.1 hypothetical protein [Vicinamibacterales bacterium]|tara:strand:+ start:1562 stop:2020 length:459 start_codon:yes stop_codon:yes gene_type:complete
MDSRLTVVLWTVVLVFVAARLMFWLIARFSRWDTLAGLYPAPGPLDGRRFRFQYVEFRRWLSYNGCVTITVNPIGLGLSLTFILELSHAPIFVPWEDLRATLGKRFGFTVVQLAFARGPDVKLTLSRRAFDRIADASGGRMHAEDPRALDPA